MRDVGVIVFFTGVILIAAMTCCAISNQYEFREGYRAGQIDALNNHYKYQRVDTADGGTQYIELGKMVSK